MRYSPDLMTIIDRQSRVIHVQGLQIAPNLCMQHIRVRYALSFDLVPFETVKPRQFTHVSLEPWVWDP